MLWWQDAQTDVLLSSQSNEMHCRSFWPGGDCSKSKQEAAFTLIICQAEWGGWMGTPRIVRVARLHVLPSLSLVTSTLRQPLWCCWTLFLLKVHMNVSVPLQQLLTPNLLAWCLRHGLSKLGCLMYYMYY